MEKQFFADRRRLSEKLQEGDCALQYAQSELLAEKAIRNEAFSAVRRNQRERDALRNELLHAERVARKLETDVREEQCAVNDAIRHEANAKSIVDGLRSSLVNAEHDAMTKTTNFVRAEQNAEACHANRTC